MQPASKSRPARPSNEAVDRVTSEALKGPGEVTLSLITFNEEIRDILTNEPADKVRKLSPNDYVPAGCTALLDAVAHGIDLLEQPGADASDVAAWQQTTEGTARMAEELSCAVEAYRVDRRAGGHGQEGLLERDQLTVCAAVSGGQRS